MSRDVGAGSNVGGAYIMGPAKRAESKEANYSFINENLDFLRIKYSNLYSQRNEQDLLVLFKTENFQKM